MKKNDELLFLICVCIDKYMYYIYIHTMHIWILTNKRGVLSAPAGGGGVGYAIFGIRTTLKISHIIFHVHTKHHEYRIFYI